VLCAQWKQISKGNTSIFDNSFDFHRFMQNQWCGVQFTGGLQAK
jgi:hypothetical protein